jgi:hypothetical protein
MRILVRIIVLGMVGVLLMSCAGRRAARQAEMREGMMHRQGFACTVPAVGVCPGCNITCAMGQPATCTPGKSAGDRCTVQPSCKCGPS